MKLFFNQLTGEYACQKMRESKIVLSKKKSKTYEKYNVLNTLLKREMQYVPEKRMNKESLETELCDALKDIPYYNNIQKSEDIHEMAFRMELYEKQEKRVSLKPRTVKVKLDKNNEVEVEVEVDLVFADIISNKQNKGIMVVEATKVSYQKPSISSRGRTMDTCSKQNLQIYSLILAAKKIAEDMGYKNFLAVGTIIFLRNKEKDIEKANSFVEEKQKVSESLMVKDGEIEEVGISLLNSYQLSLEKYLMGITCNKTTCDKCMMYEKCNYKETPKGVIALPAVHHIADYQLSKEQERIVKFDKGIARVNAGAGAGKTMVTALNVVNLIAKGEEAKRILLITFTNAGVLEMKIRSKNLLSDYGLEDEAEEVVITTFNKFGDDLISRNWSLLGYSNKPHLVDEIEIMDIVLEILPDNERIEGLRYDFDLTLSFPYVKGAAARLIELFDTIKKQNYSKEAFMKVDLEDIVSDKAKEQIYQLYQMFEEKLLERNLIQFQDQENLVFKLLELRPDIFEKLGFEHIIVDEFQDSSPNQLELIKALTNTKSFVSLMVVGDDSQSIFGFRDTSPENIINFDRLLGKKVKDFYLINNYRSTPEIIEAANAANELITTRIEKKLISKKGNGSKPILCGFDSQKEDEIPVIARRIKDLVDKGVNRSDICFIARKKKELLLMQNELSKLGVFALPEVPIKMLDNSKVQAAIGLAKFFLDLHATQGLYLYLNVLMDNTLGTDKMALDLFLRNVKWIREAWYLMSEKERKDYFFTLIDAITGEDDIYISFVEKVKARENYCIRELLEYIEKYELYSSNAEASIIGDLDSVCLTTFHSSKGREWDYVFVSISLLDEQRNGEESQDETRRLIFVGITRARKELTVSSVKKISGVHPYPHRYFTELKETKSFILI